MLMRSDFLFFFSSRRRHTRLSFDWSSDVCSSDLGAAYRRGAKFVDVAWFDPLVKRERIAHAADDTLDFVPSWYGERALQLGEQRCPRISFTGAVEPDAMAGLDPARSGRDQLPFLKEFTQLI